MKLLVTNYRENIIKQPIENVEYFKGKDLKEDEFSTLCVNGCIWYSIFEKLPTMRNIDANKAWFNGFIISRS